MKITVYHKNYHKRAVVEVSTVNKAEEMLNYFYNTARGKTPLFKIDDSAIMTYNEARVYLGFKPDPIAAKCGD